MLAESRRAVAARSASHSATYAFSVIRRMSFHVTWVSRPTVASSARAASMAAPL